MQDSNLEEKLKKAEQTIGELRKELQETREGFLSLTAELEDCFTEHANELSKPKSKYQNIFKNAPDGIFQISPEGEILMANPVMAQMLGYESPGELMKIKGSRSSDSPDGYNPGLQLFRIMHRNEELAKYETNFCLKDGREIWISINSHPVKDSNGELQCYEGMIEDITNRKSMEQSLEGYRNNLEELVREQTLELTNVNKNLRDENRMRAEVENKLRQQKELLQAIIDNIPVMITIYDEKFNMKLLNNEFTRLTGWKQEDAEGNDILDKCFPAPKVGEFIREHLINGTMEWRDFEVKTRDGEILDTCWSNVKLSDEMQIGIGLDITGRKRTERELEKYREHLEELVEQRTIELKKINKHLQDEILERKNAEQRQEFTMDVLKRLNMSGSQRDVIGDILMLVKKITGIEAISIRLKQGEDYPYYTTVGFPPEFIEAENFLCARDLEGQILRDDLGNPILECMCGNILKGRTDPKLPFFTEGGSFWSSNTTKLLASTTEEDRQARTRNRCNSEGYESVALIPLRSRNEIIGLLQLNDKRTDQYELEIVKFFEGIGASIGIALDRIKSLNVLEASERKFRMLFDNAADAIFIHNLDGKFIEVNNVACERLGYSREELLKLGPIGIDMKENVQLFNKRVKEIEEKSHALFEIEHVKKDGTVIPIELSSRIIEYEGESAILSVARDITERKHMLEQLQQVQKMEAVGRLAGGVAHDFNNLLTGILGSVELARMEIPPDSEILEYIDEIDSTSKKASELVKQLLAFSRKQVITPKVLNLNETIRDLEKMFRRLIMENIELRTILAPAISNIKIDPGQLEQVIVNLVVNAADAIPEGGRLIIKTRMEFMTGDRLRKYPYVIEGEYVLLEISDTGTGMDKKTISQIFEPFFTTKEKGKGTGLGLSTVYGIVKQAGGYIIVYSELGYGSTFRIYFPPSVEKISDKTIEKLSEKNKARSGKETILLVEDEDFIRKLLRRVLRMAGYKALYAMNAEEAELLCTEDIIVFNPDLLVTDVILPDVNGKELSNRLSRINPEMKILFMSGYSQDVFSGNFVLEEDVNFIEKPFGLDDMLDKIREVLDTTK
ncbi:MAG: PAS domain S-box protein [Candidatus Eremiobacteraeota bacterium]|nr:PAS domain S-box protein [Candidatus Eremiobacteraeota bacterium]